QQSQFQLAPNQGTDFRNRLRGRPRTHAPHRGEPYLPLLEHYPCPYSRDEKGKSLVEGARTGLRGRDLELAFNGHIQPRVHLDPWLTWSSMLQIADDAEEVVCLRIAARAEHADKALRLLKLQWRRLLESPRRLTDSAR